MNSQNDNTDSKGDFVLKSESKYLFFGTKKVNDFSNTYIDSLKNYENTKNISNETLIIYVPSLKI